MINKVLSKVARTLKIRGLKNINNTITTPPKDIKSGTISGGGLGPPSRGGKY